jgi:cytochrome c oxidase cbb3-type subunit 3
MKPTTLTMSIAMLVAAVASGCEREARRFDKTGLDADARAQADAVSDLQVGHAGRGMRALAAAGGYTERNAYALAQGRIYYRWFNCTGCHAQGGGAIGPPLMDENWIYGKDPDAIFATIMEGRPNGMPSFRGRIPEEQAWQIVAYVRSMSCLVSSDSAPNRGDTLLGGPPENLRDPMRSGDRR